MKKTLIALFALAGAAVGAGEAITLPDSDGFSWIKGNDIAYRADPGQYSPTFSPTNSSIDAVVIVSLAAYIEDKSLSRNGWYGGLEGANENNSDISIHDRGFTFDSRSGMGGEYVALGISKDIQASSITLSFTATNNVVCSLWSYDVDTKEATLLDKETAVTSGSLSYDNDIETSQLFVVWGSRPSEGALNGSNKITVDNISLSYTAAATVTPGPSAPEPTTATLSLLALAGLAARRRRR